jgi:protein-disulfide isomerase
MNRFLPFLIIVIVLIAAAGGTWLFMRSSKQGGATQSPTSETGTLPTGAEPPHIRGNPNAPVTLEEFGDFQCPTCGFYATELKKIEAEFGDQLRVIFRENPLQPPHEHALVAAQAAEAAGLQNRFWEMHDKLYENQKIWSEARDITPLFVDFARQLDLDTDRFMKDLNGEQVAQRIFQDGKRSHALGVQSTPTFFINGKEAKDWKPEGLREMIKQAQQGTAGQ